MRFMAPIRADQDMEAGMLLSAQLNAPVALTSAGPGRTGEPVRYAARIELDPHSTDEFWPGPRSLSLEGPARSVQSDASGWRAATMRGSGRSRLAPVPRVNGD